MCYTILAPIKGIALAGLPDETPDPAAPDGPVRAFAPVRFDGKPDMSRAMRAYLPSRSLQPKNAARLYPTEQAAVNAWNRRVDLELAGHRQHYDHVFRHIDARRIDLIRPEQKERGETTMSETKKNTSQLLAEHIIKNGHACPFDDASGIDFENECVGFGAPGCRECLLQHAGRLDACNHMNDMLGNDLSSLRSGDYILYQNGRRVEIGLVKRVDFTDHVAYVWYSEGDTAARTPFANLVKLQNGRVIQDTLLGSETAKAMLGPGSNP